MSSDMHSPRVNTDASRRAPLELEDALHRAEVESRKDASPIARHLRDGAIRAFEFTFELGVNPPRRVLKTVEAKDVDIDDLAFAELLRLAHKRNLVESELRIRRNFRAARNRTSHTYSEATAQVVFETIPPFVAEVEHLPARVDDVARRPDDAT